jgi:hypothetical protein
VASADDGTFAPEVLSRLTTEHQSRLKSLWADGKYRNHGLNAWLVKEKVGYAIDVVDRPAGSVGFVEQPQRYAVERTFAWLGRYRRQSRDYERFSGSSEAMALKRRRGTIGDRGYAVLRGKVHAEVDRLLAGTYTDPDNARLAKRLRKQREHLLRFLDHDGVDATNNLAEREIRPAVIARKLSAGNRTEAGAETHAVLATILRTSRRQGRDILLTPGDLLRHGSGHILAIAGPSPGPQAGVPT